MIDLSVLIANSPTSDLAGQNCIENAKNSHKKGMVYLVGAGSGDPELLTLKAWRVMQRAEVVLYDSLVSEDVLDMCASTAEKIFVGKRRANHALSQQSINELLVKHALAGKTVVTLLFLDAVVKSCKRWYVMVFILNLFRVLRLPALLQAAQRFH